MDGTVANNDPFDLRSVFHQKIETEKWILSHLQRNGENRIHIISLGIYDFE